MHNEICNTVQDSRKAKEFFLQMLAFMITPAMLMKKFEKHKDRILIFDMRDYEDYLEGHIPYAQHVPIDEFDDNIKMFDKDKINIFYGYSPFCQRGTKAAYILADKGYPVKEIIGGYFGWVKSGLDVIKNDSDDFKM